MQNYWDLNQLIGFGTAESATMIGKSKSECVLGRVSGDGSWGAVSMSQMSEIWLGMEKTAPCLENPIEQAAR